MIVGGDGLKSSSGGDGIANTNLFVAPHEGIGTLTNNGTIAGGNGGNSGGAGGAGVHNLPDGTIGVNGVAGTGLVNNKGALISGGSGSNGGAGGAGVANSGTITRLTNLGAIQGAPGGRSVTGGAGGAGVSNTGTIAALTNSGQIIGGGGAEGGVGGGGAGGAGVSNASGATIATFTNDKGAVIKGGAGGPVGGKGGDGVYNTGSLGTGGFVNNGTIDDPGYAIYSTGTIGPMTNTGQVIGDVFIAQANVVITGGSEKTFGSWTGGTMTINGDLKFTGGNTDLGDNILIDDGTGTVSNIGVLRLRGQQTIFGNFDQNEGGALDFALAGDAPGEYGALTVTRNATLFGELALDLANGFTLAAGDRFDLMTFGSESGDFGGVSVNGASCSAGFADTWLCAGPGLYFDVTIGAGGLTVTTTAIPEPSTWAMTLAGFAGLGWLAHMRRREPTPA
jgi:hypothetical protein